MDAEFEKQFKKEMRKRFPDVSGADLLRDAKYKGVGKDDIRDVQLQLNNATGYLNREALESSTPAMLHRVLDEIESVRKAFYESVYKDTRMYIICEMAMLYLENLIAVVEEREKKKSE
ncbi:MAG: hypothetical protein IKB07_08240 [Lachnospiraceae bacterium]|nr:hypothetical protein [Lachnospiraceae bacterium]